MSALVQPSATRRFLFLQGVASPFFSQLGYALREQGCETFKIHICLGDRFFWRGGRQFSYQGRFSNWHRYIRDFIIREKITDLILFGDCRPYHAVALEEARKQNIRLHIFEEGYYRPNWITLEHEAVNAGSSLPRTSEAIHAAASVLPRSGRAIRVQNSFVRRAVWDIVANCATAFGIGLYPFYRHHRPVSPIVEYLAWIPRLIQRKSRNQEAEKAIDNLISATDKNIFLLPLQLDSDYQIRNYSASPDMKAVMEQVVESFAAHAPADACLVVKVHPLDNGMACHRKALQQIVQKFGVEKRVIGIDGGNLGRILRHSTGIVVVNSTVGLHALRGNRAVKVLGEAFYNIEGLTAQNSLDAFWKNPVFPDRKLYRDFHRVVMAQTQINGGYYSRQGVDIAVKCVIERIVA